MAGELFKGRTVLSPAERAASARLRNQDRRRRGRIALLDRDMDRAKQTAASLAMPSRSQSTSPTTSRLRRPLARPRSSLPPPIS